MVASLAGFADAGLFASSEWMAARAGRPELGGRAGLAAVALILLIFAFALPANYQHPKQAFGEARDCWVDEIRRDAPVVTVGLASLPYRLYFAPSRPGWHEVESAEELEALARDGPLFVIHTFPT
jgi:hypothetical protein